MRMFPTNHQVIIDQTSERSKHQGYWGADIGSILDEGWRVCYTEGTGIQGMVARAAYSTDREGGLRDTATVAEGELQEIHLALTTEDSDMVAILSDSQAAIQSISNMSKGALPRSGIEADIKTALVQSADRRDVKIAGLEPCWYRREGGLRSASKAT